MSFGDFAQAPIESLISDCSNSTRLALMLGAGASIEAGLPGWALLIEKLLTRTIEERGLLEDDGEKARKRWVNEVLRRDGYLGAAAIVEALNGEVTLDSWIPEALYSGGSAENFPPGPICRQLPQLAAVFGTSFSLMTTNYDDLAEEALRNDPDHPLEAVSYVGVHRTVPAAAVRVDHLHGYAGRDGTMGTFVLSESDYQQMQQTNSWQEAQVRAALANGMFVFVGASLSDPNLIRYLYSDAGAGETPPRYAIFVRQDTYEKEVPPGVREARETAVRARWEKLGVIVVFVDHYVDVAQVLYEMGRAKRMGDDYVPLPRRAQDWVRTVDTRLLGIDSAEQFVKGQRICRDHLCDALASAVSAAEELEGRRWEEKLALTMWLIDEEGSCLINRATTDRIHLDRGTVEPVAIDEYARWVAVRSYCRGQPLAERRDIYASRWRFIRGTPITIETERHGRIPVGCLTTASMADHEETMLNEMEDVVEARFNQTLITSALALLDQPFR
jgi:SIR2-like domain